MLFASIELAARIEQAERRLVVDCTASAAARDPERAADGEGSTFELPIGGGAATYSGPGSPLNKVVGLGFDGPVRGDELEAVEQAFARRGAPVQVELSCLADPAIARLLTERGYVLMGFENVLGRGLAPGELAASSSTDVEISRVALDATERSSLDPLAPWLDVVVTGFATPDGQGVESHEDFPRESLERIIGSMARTAGFSCYLARREREPAGGATLRVCEGVAQLCGTSTLPAHRRRGVQTALLAARLADAAAAGCDLAVVTTLPGSRSQHNVQRHGFELLYTRAILVREPG